ncbi:monothiol glutaredoxin-S1-like [Prosopis cineraria]|uniref:monothiol glutaredoxin-S1-like n=1 Tax=Prosopis cineraria TaxID=364024 RepID=UPI00240EFA48|nr:monothiol glutaredoxin-S1-like [Prosopis cineraria]
MDLITSMVAEKPVVIFSKTSCCLSYSIKSLISGFGAHATVYEIDQISNGMQIERELIELGCQPSVPAVFIGQKFIGGANHIMSLHVRNELVTLLMNAKAIWIWNKK